MAKQGKSSLLNLALSVAGAVAVSSLAVLVITVPMDLQEQWIFAGVSILGAMIMTRVKGQRATLAIAALSLLVSTRYIVWRTTTTLDFDSPIGFFLGTGLYLAELYAWIILVLGFLQTAWQLPRPVIEPVGPPEEWPTVDVYVPTYNESLEIVANTVYAAMDMDYPPERFRVFILDDGRRPEFQAFARQAGCGYLTRADNLHAKAGNMNAAMKKTDGELIAIFDCDHVPVRAFLQLTVGWFNKDPKLALMQTPHHFYSPDPVQRNLGESVSDLPGEGDLFYGAVQRGNDLWNATFFCGSCAIIRREALMQTNGFAGETVTEDAHTALKLQRMGWNTAYLGTRLSAGLATERLVIHIGQRIRWARGMTQIFRIDNPLLGKGLKFTQRLCYLNAMLHFQFPLPRIVFLTSPLAYLLAGQNIIHASAALIFAYALPHLVVSAQSSERTQGGDRRPFWGEVYETLLCFHLVKPTVFTMFQPRKGKFNVTDKGGMLNQTYYDFTTVRPHLIVAGLLVAGIAFGCVKYFFFPHIFNIQLDTLLLNTTWAVFSLVTLIAALSVARERRQTRQHIRIDVALPVTLHFEDGYVVEGVTRDISMGGFAATMPQGFTLQGRSVTAVSLPMGDDTLTIEVETVRMDRGIAQVRFEPLEPIRARLLVRAVMGRCDAWQQAKPTAAVSSMRSMADILKVDSLTLRRIFASALPGKKRRAAAAAAMIALLGAAALFATARPAFAQAMPDAAVPDPDASAVAGAVPAALPAGPGAKRERVTLKDLRVTTPIRLAGVRGEIGIPFGMRGDQVVSDATLTLNFAYSPSMLGDLSQLVVLLNGEVVRTIQLDPGAAAGQVLSIPVNPALFLPGNNQLNLRLLGHYARDCEDPFHSSLWANVSNVRSYFELTTQALPLAPNLQRLPNPFYDQYDIKPLSLPFVFAGSPNDPELEAAASVASWFGGMASYRGFTFKPSFGALPQGNAVVFMTPGRGLPGIPNNITGASLGVIRNPADPTGQLLLVMGRDARELKLAAAALASGRGVFGGALVSVDNARIPAYPRYGAPKWLRSDRPVRLGEIAPSYRLEGLGLPPGPLTTDFRAAPDLFFWPRQGANLKLHYRYPGATWLDRRASRLDLSVNGQYLQTLPLGGASWWDRLFAQEYATAYTSRADVVLPRYNLFGQNQLIFDYNLVIADKKKCQGTVPDNVHTSVLPDSTIDLTHAYHALRMPDLAAFANAGYPFTIRPDLAETAVVMATQPSSATVEAYLQLMGRFGDATGAPVTGVTVTRAIDSEALGAKDIIVIGGSQLAQSEQLFAKAPVRFEDGRLRVPQRTMIERIFYGYSPFDRAPEAADAFLYNTNSFTGIVSFESPFGKSHSVVALLASDTVTLPGMIEGLADVKVNAMVQGDLSVVNGDGMVSYAVGDTYWVGDLPWFMRLAYWFSQHPILMAFSAIIVAILICGPIYHLLKRQERKRLAAIDKA